MNRFQTVTAALLLCCGTGAQAASFTFKGAFANDNDVAFFSFSLRAPGEVELRTRSYSGGLMGDGSVVPAGGFDPILTLFDSTGSNIALGDDVSASDFDAGILRSLGAGRYTLALTQYDNDAGPSLSDPFFRASEPRFTAVFGCSNGIFCAPFSTSANLTGDWAVDLIGVDRASAGLSAVPVPASLPLLAAGLIALGAMRRRS